MTIIQAKSILKQAGEQYSSPAGLRGIRDKAYDPLIKKACDRLLERGVYDK